MDDLENKQEEENSLNDIDQKNSDSLTADEESEEFDLDSFGFNQDTNNQSLSELNQELND